MRREIDMDAISDGRLYGPDDMVKAGCRGCSHCCREMGKSIVLDPLDAYRITKGLGCTFDGLLDGHVELNVQEGVILPNLKMTGPLEQCAFLDKAGRCGIHAFRPGLCRLFPLGRIYEDGAFQYFLQVHECKNTARAKVKVRKWIDMPNFKSYERFVSSWHFFVLKLQDMCSDMVNEELVKRLSLYVLEQFYRKGFTGENEEEFYPWFEESLREAEIFAAGFA